MSEARFGELSRSEVFFKAGMDLWVLPENERPGGEGWDCIGNIGEIFSWARREDPIPMSCEDISLEMVERNLGKYLDEFEDLSEEISAGQK